MRLKSRSLANEQNGFENRKSCLPIRRRRLKGCAMHFGSDLRVLARALKERHEGV
jgi:hypothetical protein